MELKPCPFCGGSANMVTYQRRDGYAAEVYCTSGADIGCFAVSRHWAGRKEWAEETAITAWNRRKESDNVHT